jgi:hypothetical protein
MPRVRLLQLDYLNEAIDRAPGQTISCGNVCTGNSKGPLRFVEIFVTNGSPAQRAS